MTGESPYSAANINGSRPRRPRAAHADFYRQDDRIASDVTAQEARHRSAPVDGRSTVDRRQFVRPVRRTWIGIART